MQHIVVVYTKGFTYAFTSDADLLQASLRDDAAIKVWAKQYIIDSQKMGRAFEVLGVSVVPTGGFPYIV